MAKRAAAPTGGEASDRIGGPGYRTAACANMDGSTAPPCDFKRLVQMQSVSSEQPGVCYKQGMDMTPGEFIAKWRASELKERSASQEHFIDLCRLLDEPTPTPPLMPPWQQPMAGLRIFPMRRRCVNCWN